ncbi:MAG TPA: hypothetical protein VFA46_22235 [Actinomycetes bacterium]|jgi:hypothetical protein|nr:hypothetical protein [Actinomycetes bacterium]
MRHRRAYQTCGPDQLRQAHQEWLELVDKWVALRNPRRTRRCLLQVKTIELVARRRRIHL